ncbi:type II/IV secretion system protein [bacterium]|nr:type II/IV secretion system protein [bacterium]
MDLIAQLVKQKKIKRREASKLKAEAKRREMTQEEIILEKKILPEKNLFELKSKLTGFPLRETLPEKIPSKILEIIPRDSVEYYKIAPLSWKKDERVLEVGMIYPENPQAREALKFLTRQQKLQPKIYLISFSYFKKYLEQYRTPKKEVERALERLEEEIKLERPKLVKKEEFDRLVEEAPVIKMVGVILRQAVEGRASDIHIEPTRENLRVRYRLDGVLHSSLILPLKVLPAIVARIKILSRLKIDETRIPQDGRFSTKIGEKTIDFRVSTFPTTLGEKVAIRVLDPEEGLKSLAELGLSQRNFEVVQRAIKKPYGMILATGPTGCGKTTTLYALFRILNKEGVNIVTLEDPVEYFIDGINQSQIRPEIDYTFARGLRQILRQDPDIIMVGEIRDTETAALATHAALTGHLVLSTLHTNNVMGVIPRLIDMGVQPFLIPPTLSLAIAQRLVRALCPFCKKKVKLTGEPKRYLLEKIKNLPPKMVEKYKTGKSLYIYQPKGCKKCNYKGYSGRIGVFEIIEMTDSLAEITLQKPSEKEILREGRSQGMITMEEDGALKVLAGVTSLEEIMRVAEEK